MLMTDQELWTALMLHDVKRVVWEAPDAPVGYEPPPTEYITNDGNPIPQEVCMMFEDNIKRLSQKVMDADESRIGEGEQHIITFHVETASIEYHRWAITEHDFVFDRYGNFGRFGPY